MLDLAFNMAIKSRSEKYQVFDGILTAQLKTQTKTIRHLYDD